MAKPVRDAKRLTRLLCDKVETIAPGFGIETMILAATLTEPLERSQVVSSLVEETVPDVSDLIDTLMNRVGERAIYRLAPVASDVPERSVRQVPASHASQQSFSPRSPRLEYDAGAACRMARRSPSMRSRA